MQDIINQYIKNVRLFFPRVRKEERAFLDDLKKRLYELCEEENITDYASLEARFGSARETAGNYLLNCDSEKLIRSLRIRKAIHTCLIILFSLAVIAAIVYIIIVLKEYHILLQQSTLFD